MSKKKKLPDVAASLRGTGRTHKLLEEAVKYVLGGEDVVFYVHTHRMIEHCANILGRIVEESSLPLRRLSRDMYTFDGKVLRLRVLNDEAALSYRGHVVRPMFDHTCSEDLATATGLRQHQARMAIQRSYDNRTEAIAACAGKNLKKQLDEALIDVLGEKKP